MRIIFLIFCIIMLFFFVHHPAQCADPATTIYFNGGIISMDQPPLEVKPIYGIKLEPKDNSIKSRERKVYFPHTLENLSNDTNRIVLEIINKSTQEGFVAELVLDDNNDGIHQEHEVTPTVSVTGLSEGSMMHIFLRMALPSKTITGEVFSATVRASSKKRDGVGYVGNNGIIYGGDDVVESTDTLVIK